MAAPMLSRRVYYGLKPFLPWRVRLAIRRWLALPKRRRSAEVWPILPGSEKPPPGWPGWPEGKQFALVLTHDVEGTAGIAKCRQLMELELRLGFRSSFNFIPEGECPIPADLRQELTRQGFEVGVHDLRHDGKLYQSRRAFAEKAVRINRYLRDWGAVGFRSGFMLHELSWLHDLNILYDASTFDTDPFEPQPHGQRTIFPFFVRRPEVGKQRPELTPSDAASGNDAVPAEVLPSALRSPPVGYVELPYTLPQDSTLFLLLGERSIDVWRRKLDWVAQHGGMVLVNVHPDYARFPGQPADSRTFPSAFYEELLQYVRQRYAPDYWHPLPRDMARFVAGLASPPAPRRRVCMVTHSYYESDRRVRRYGEALAERGDEVEAIALRRNGCGPREQIVDGVRVFYLQTRAGRKERSKVSYLLPLLRFSWVASSWLRRRHRANRYDLVHVHNVPDFLVFAAWYPRRAGARIILDIHDIVPEFFVSKFGVSPTAPAVRMLQWVERRAAAFADHVILSNHLWFEKFTRRSAPPEKCSVFINYVDTEMFRPRPRPPSQGRRIVMFPGGLQWHQGVDIAIRAMAKLCARLPEAEFHIYGEGNLRGELEALARELGLTDKVRFFDFLPLREIADRMAVADVGVVPKRADTFGNEAFSTKILEFLALGVPMVVSDTQIDRFYFDDSVVEFFESGNETALAEALLRVLSDGAVRRERVARGLALAARNSWGSRKGDYLRLVDRLLNQ